LIPLKDNIPTLRFPIVTVLLIAANLAVFVWQLTASGDEYSSPEFRQLGIPESDQRTIEYGAIPYRITHPGDDCAAGAVLQESGGASAEVVCQETAEYRQARAATAQGAPFAPLDEPVWWVTLLTSMFMHAGILHIAGNMLFLWVFGNNVEDSMGRFRFLLFYLLAGLVAVYAQAIIDPNATGPTIGASGAVSGVLGGYILLHPHARVLTLIFIVFFVTFIEIPAVVMLGLWFVLQAIPAVGQLAPDVAGEGGGVAYLAHVGGFLFGLALIKVFATRRQETEPPGPPYPVY
jgi:membrane associated rhomboid family serine protease